MPVSPAQYQSIRLYAVLLYIPALIHHPAYEGSNLRRDDGVMQLTRRPNPKEGHEQVQCFHTSVPYQSVVIGRGLCLPLDPAAYGSWIQGC